MSHWFSGRDWQPSRQRQIKKRAAVLGCGPAGLFAAHGLIQSGWNVSILSNKRKSRIFGAQYLHAPIPGVTPVGESPERLTYRLRGEVDGYRQKVYGQIPVKVSPEALDMEHDTWDLRVAYDRAWEIYGDRVQNVRLDRKEMGVRTAEEVADGEPGPAIDWTQFGAIVSTIPLDRLCYRPEEHQFHSTLIWAIGDAAEFGQLAPYRPNLNTVECDGTSDVGWYRAANVRGHVTVEWPGRSRPPLPEAAPVHKPIYTNCNCYRDGSFPVPFHPLGRYGQWSKGVLAHHAYTQAANL